MINLLPHEAKKQLRAARTNVILVRYIAVIITAFAFILLILGGSYYLLMLTKTSAQRLIEANDTQAAVYSSTQNQINELSSNLTNAKATLDTQVLYSKALSMIAQYTPQGSVLGTISFDQNSFNGTPTTLKFYTTSAEAATTLSQQLQNTPIFTNVKIDKVSENDGITGYPTSVDVTLTFNKAAAQ